MLALRLALDLRQLAIGIARGWLDLDDVSTEIGENRRAGRRGNEACAVENLEVCKQRLRHERASPRDYPAPMRLSQAASSMTSMPSSRALSSFEPAPGPA